MCGICGAIDLGGGPPVSRRLLEEMNCCMAHRGPDAEGYHLSAGVGFGHRRLKIIDLEGGVQPMYNDDHSVVVVFNGEIYNYRDLRQQLEKRGHRFRTNSDTEVIVRAYEEYGLDCVQQFRGMFGIAIHDAARKRSAIWRDRLGIKPVYYHCDQKRLVFASEIKPVLRALDSRPEVSLAAIDYFMSVGYVPGEMTMFQGVKKLLPGHYLVVENGRLRTGRYWDIQDDAPLSLSFDEALEQLDTLLREAIGLRMVSDVPLGAFLSGGVDSSAVVSYMTGMSDEPVKTFSVGYHDDPASSELEYARIIAKEFNTEHHEYFLEPLEFFDSLDVLLEHSEEPIVESAAIALYQLSRLAREHVTVILSGEGSDEVLAGYPLYRVMNKVDRLHRVAGRIPEPVASVASRFLEGSEKLLKYWDWSRMGLGQRYQGISNDVTLSIKRAMYQAPELMEAHERTAAYYRALFEKLGSSSSLRKMTYVDIKSWLPDDLLIKADKMTMAASLELRVPFLDHKVVEFASALPDHYRIRGQEGKHILKVLMERYLPRSIIYREKKGFPVPISRWFQGPLYEQIRDRLLDGKAVGRGYFRPAYVEKILERHSLGKEDLSRRILSLLVLEEWHTKYVD